METRIGRAQTGTHMLDVGTIGWRIRLLNHGTGPLVCLFETDFLLERQSDRKRNIHTPPPCHHTHTSARSLSQMTTTAKASPDGSQGPGTPQARSWVSNTGDRDPST